MFLQVVVHVNPLKGIAVKRAAIHCKKLNKNNLKLYNTEL
jgi:hypothetical protein